MRVDQHWCLRRAVRCHSIDCSSSWGVQINTCLDARLSTVAAIPSRLCHSSLPHDEGLLDSCCVLSNPSSLGPSSSCVRTKTCAFIHGNPSQVWIIVGIEVHDDSTFTWRLSKLDREFFLVQSSMESPMLMLSTQYTTNVNVGGQGAFYLLSESSLSIDYSHELLLHE